MNDTDFSALLTRLARFIDEQVIPVEPRQHEPAPQPFGRPPVFDDLRQAASDAGLAHLFSFTRHAELDLSTVQAAHLAELTGRSPLLAQDAVGSLNPDAEVINLLARFGTTAQQERWLQPLREGRIGSALCITEPDVASSDPSGLQTLAAPDGQGGFVLNGHKAWSLGGLSPICQLLVVLAVTAPDAPARSRLSLLLVPVDAAGVHRHDPASFYGYGNAPRGGLPRVDFTDVAVGAHDVLGPLHDGLATVQTSLGPARLFHCMRLVGAGERALALMCARLSSRPMRGKPLADNALWLDRVAESRIAIDQARTLTLAVAAKVDAHGLDAAGVDISKAKAAVPEAMCRVIDLAIQAHGSEGMSHTLPLAGLWSLARSLRFSDGPDEVHRVVVARAELKRQAAARTAS